MLNLLRHYVPQVTGLDFAGEKAEDAGCAEAPTQALQRLLESQINPAVAAHGGAVRLVSIADGTASIRFEGRCQGCALAEVTLRQGVEVMIKQAIPAISAVVDLTDHEMGRDPYFKTKKGAD